VSTQPVALGDAPAPISEQVLILEAGRADKHDWTDRWRYWELFFILAWRDVSVRYKQTVIGLLWAVIRPFLTMVVFTVIFGRLAGLPSDGDAQCSRAPRAHRVRQQQAVRVRASGVPGDQRGEYSGEDRVGVSVRHLCPT
jgi:hypothetical protein